MNKKVSMLSIVVLLAFLACLAFACGGKPASDSPSATASAPTLSGAQLLEERCGSCHAVTRTTSARNTRADWETIVTRMVRNGANLTDAEVQTLVQHLADKYGK